VADYEIAVVGGGPAGLTAALFAARHGRSTILLDPLCMGGAILNTERIEDFPGFPEGVPGFDFGPRLQEQAANAGATVEPAETTRIERRGDEWCVATDAREITAGAVIVATGSRPRTLGVPREDELEGKGLSHCASCDGPLYRGQKVAMVGGGDSALLETLELGGHDVQVVLVDSEESFGGPGDLRPARARTRVRRGPAPDLRRGDPRRRAGRGPAAPRPRERRVVHVGGRRRIRPRRARSEHGAARRRRSARLGWTRRD
jgi:thioredoxin reductase (NADPH)